MTLVQTLLTPNGVIQVSDRQLTTISGKAVEQTANKAVIWCGHMVVGFSGMAFTDSSRQRPISEWIAVAMRDAITVGDAASALQQAGHELMAYTDIQRKKLTMILAGAPPGKHNLLYKISNVEHPMQAARPDFYVKTMHIPLHDGQYRYHTTGVHINPQYQQSYEGELARIHSNFGVNHAAQSMIALQRRVRNKQLEVWRGTTVGQSAMVVSLPAMTEPKQVTLIITGTTSAEVDDRWPMYSFVAAYGFSRVRFTPHFVCRGATRIDPKSWASPGGTSTGLGLWSHVP